MTPAFVIMANSEDVTSKIRDRLLSLRITDEAGLKSDTAEFSVDDREGVLELPVRGVKLKISLGYKETDIYLMGTYVVDEVEVAGPPDAITVRAKAADMIETLKSPKTRPWDAVTLGDLVTTIAGEHGYAALVDAGLAAIRFDHLDQTEESDLHLLTRLAGQYDAVAKPANGYLLLKARGSMRSADGKDLPTISLRRSDLTAWRCTYADRGKYKTVKAYYHDPNTGKRVEVRVGTEDPAYALRHTYPDETQAQAAANARAKAFDRGEGKLSLTMDGNPLLAAECIITLSGVRDKVDGAWLITRVTHELSENGYRCSVEAEQPNSDGESGDGESGSDAGSESGTDATDATAGADAGAMLST